MEQNDTPYAFAFAPASPSVEEPIGKREFERIEKAARHVFDVQEIEDLYEMFVKAVWKFDQIFFRHADLARFENGSEDSFFQNRQEINNASVEVFSILQMFLDYQSDNPHVKSEPLPRLADDPDVQKCKALRNYLQHGGTFPLVISTGKMICAQTVDFSSVRFRMKRDDFDLGRVKPSTKKIFETVFPSGTDIDLYEIVSRGFDAVTEFLKKTRSLAFFSDEYEECAEFLKAWSNRTWEKGQIFLRFADGKKRDGRDAIMPYLADKNIKRIEVLRSRYLCRPISQVYVTNAPEEFLKDCNKAFFTAAASAKRFSQHGQSRRNGSAPQGAKPSNGKGTTP